MDGEQLEKYKNMAINTAVIVVALVIALNIYQRNLSASASLKARISEEQKKSGEMKKISRIERKIASYKKLLVKKEASAIMNDINDMAREADIKVVSIKPSRGESEADYNKDSFNVIVSAPNYNAAGRFIYLVESFDSLYMVDSLVINNEAEAGRGNLTVNLRISSVVAAGQ